MDLIGVEQLQNAITDIENIRVLLAKLMEQDLEKLVGYKPVITVLFDACTFIMSNLNVICKRLEQR